jgi:hypothetical protein
MITRRIFWALTMTSAMMAISAAVAPVKSSESNTGSENSELKAGAQGGILEVLDRAGAGQRKALAGTWVVNVNQPGFPPSQRLFTFNSDGGLVTNDDLQVGPMGVEHFTIAQGNWTRTGNRRFAATIVGQRYNLQGSLLGTFKVRMNLELNEKSSEWSGRFRIEIILPNGNVIFTSEGTFEATRIEVEPL